MAIASIPQPQPPMVIAVPAPEAGVEATEVAAVVQAEEAAPPAESAAKASSLPLEEWAKYYGAAVAVGVLAYLIAYFALLPGCQRSTPACSPDEVFRVSSDFSVFAGLFVLALAVERLLEPLSRFIGPDTDKAADERDKALVAASKDPSGEADKRPVSDGEPNGTNTEWLAAAQAKLDCDRQIGVILHWGAAVGLSFLLAGQLNALLLAAIAAEGSARPAPWADLLVTGLVIGAGTKPLHDLVSHIEKSKENKQDPAATGGTST